MKVVEQTHERVVVEAGDGGFAWLVLAGSIGCAALAAMTYLGRIRPTGPQALQGTIAGAVIFLIAFLALFERARFEFNRSMGALVWSRRRAFGTRSGMIPFSRIETVVARSNGAEKGGKIPKWRVVVVVPGEQELPLSVGYVPDVDGAIRGVADTIRTYMS